MNRCKLLLFTSASSSNSSLSFTHTHILYLWPFPIYSLTTYAHTSYPASLHMYYLLKATGAKYLAWCNVNGGRKKNYHTDTQRHLHSLILQNVCIHITNPQSLPTKANMLCAPHTKSKAYPDRLLHGQVCLLWEGCPCRFFLKRLISSVNKDFHACQYLLLLANIHSIRQQVSSLDTKWATRQEVSLQNNL